MSSLWGRKGPENPDRSDALKHIEACTASILWAFRMLAFAGTPRVPKARRAEHVEKAGASFDLARGRLTKARYRFSACKLRLAERVKEQRAEPHDHAAVTVLEPQVQESTGSLEALRQALISHAGGSWRRPMHSEEVREAGNFTHSWHDDGIRHRCNWCGDVERSNYGAHYPLDRDGYAVTRKDAVRFCCYSCFGNGKDLAEPAPRALRPVPPLETDRPVETVVCIPSLRPALAAASDAVEAHYGE